MDEIELKINDFNLLYDTLQNLVKITNSLKIVINSEGMTSYVADDNETIRVDVTSTSVCIPNTCEVKEVYLCTKSLNTIVQLFGKIKKSHSNKSRGSVPDYSDVVIKINSTSISIKSSSLKTSVFLDNESAVHTLRPFTHELHEIADINVNIDDIKDIISSTFIFKQPDKILIDICHQDDMVRNLAYAYMSDPNDPRTNDIVIKLGNIISGDITRKVIVDIPKLKYLSLFPVTEMKLKLNQEPCFCCNFSLSNNSKTYITNYRVMGKYILPRKTLTNEDDK